MRSGLEISVRIHLMYCDFRFTELVSSWITLPNIVTAARSSGTLCKLDIGGDEIWPHNIFSYDFEWRRKSRLQSLLRSSNILLEIPYIHSYNEDKSVTMRVVIEQPIHLIESNNLLTGPVDRK
jgi:hypothetical protein